MIPGAYITEWSQYVPWRTKDQVEQDLVISRVLAAIFSDEFLSDELAFRGDIMQHTVDVMPTKELYIKNIEGKMKDPEFLGDTMALIKPDEEWVATEAYKLIKTEIIERL